ncbi:MAG: acyl-CoA dehydrogenase [Boseongicola sp. SB0664_bin_43]|uniref:Acyl-CoA dehydrogenase n=1 Tax=Boseongicola sp. SB0664_bin_43 TaxID=2604844 RepID=A0A6B0XXN4_9RHOB|nr:acyl-CoA dehydrogenase [Boseongicola sp. SB0664_bin_43]
MPLPDRQSDRLYDHRLEPEEVRAIRAEVRAFADEHVAPKAYAIGQTPESKDAFPWELFTKMGKAGMFRIPFGSTVGGRGLKHRVTACVAALEELAYHSNSVAAIYDVHCILAGRTLEAASPELQEKYLKPLLAGEVVGAFATSEPGTSSDLTPRAMATEVFEDGDELIVTGRKRWITNSPVAKFVTALCRAGDSTAMVLIDLDAPGVTVGDPDKKLGNHGQLTADITFDEVRVPKTHVISGLGQGLRRALATLTYGRIGIGATGVGMAQRIFDECTRHLMHRKMFGQYMGQMQHWQFRMAERATQIENGRNLYLKAALKMDEGQEFPEPEAAMCKFYATDVAAGFAREGIQVFGGYGFTKELAADGSHYKVEEIYRDVKITEIYEGANEIQKYLVAREIFGRNFAG